MTKNVVLSLSKDDHTLLEQPCFYLQTLAIKPSTRPAGAGLLRQTGMRNMVRRTTLRSTILLLSPVMVRQAHHDIICRTEPVEVRPDGWACPTEFGQAGKGDHL